jgi:hypothetical protein
VDCSSHKDALRWGNIRTKLVLSDPENTDALERYLLEIGINNPNSGDGQDAPGSVDELETVVVECYTIINLKHQGFVRS